MRSSNVSAPKGPRVAILTNAGGPGIMATDACIANGLEMAKLTAETQAEMLYQHVENDPPRVTATVRPL